MLLWILVMYCVLQQHWSVQKPAMHSVLKE
jgi:hypothetical protein